MKFRFLLSLTIFSACLLFLYGCRKTVSDYKVLSPTEANAIFYSNTSHLNPTLNGLVKSFQKQARFNSELSGFIVKNGSPVWDKTIYQLGNSAAPTFGNISVNAVTMNSDGNIDTSKGLFLIPLKSTSTGDIESYIAASKHNDSTYTYRLYNKDSLNQIVPSGDSAKAALRSTEAIFGVFEKSVNNHDSVQISGIIYRNARIGQKVTTATQSSKVGVNSVDDSKKKPNYDNCLITIDMTLYYEWHDTSTSWAPDGHWDLTGIVVNIQVDCVGGGGSSSGPEEPDFMGGGNWWNYGTGWPWDNPSLYNQSNPWQFFWTGTQSLPNIYESRPDNDTYDGDTFDNTVGNFDNTAFSDYDGTTPWPQITSVIPVNNFVGWGTPGISANCMSYAKAQIAQKGYKISDYDAAGQTIQVYTATGGANVNNAKTGVGYLLSALQRGIPVIVGVDDRDGSSNTGTDATTDHFVVITGSGTDAGGNYFTFFDNASGDPAQGANPRNKLYYNASTGLISGHSYTDYASSLRDYKLTMIRKSK